MSNVLSHLVQAFGFSPVWIISCIFRLSQNVLLCIFISPLVFYCLVTFGAIKWTSLFVGSVIFLQLFTFFWVLSCFFKFLYGSFYVSSNGLSCLIPCYILNRKRAFLWFGSFHASYNCHSRQISCYIWSRHLAFYLCGSFHVC